MRVKLVILPVLCVVEVGWPEQVRERVLQAHLSLREPCRKVLIIVVEDVVLVAHRVVLVDFGKVLNAHVRTGRLVAAVVVVIIYISVLLMSSLSDWVSNSCHLVISFHF